MSGYLLDSLDAPQALAGAWRATIAEDAGDFDQLVHVVIPGVDPAVQLGPCRWQARDSVSLPARGDLALVVTDDQGALWIVVWWPFT